MPLYVDEKPTDMETHAGEPFRKCCGMMLGRDLEDGRREVVAVSHREYQR